MNPAPKDLTIKRGDSFDFFFRVRTRVFDVPTQTWVPGDYANLTGFTGLAQIRATADDPVTLAEFTVSVTPGTDPDTAGSVLCHLTPDDTTPLPVGADVGVWDVELANADRSEVDTYFSGKIAVTADVSRPAP